MATINGTAGNDNLQGTPGDDLIYGAGGIDTIDAGAGDDVVNIIRGGSYAHWDYNNLIDGGAGYDVLDLSGWTKQLFVSIGYYAIVQVDEYDPVASPDLPGFTIAQARNFEEIRLGPLGADLSIFPEAVWETNPRGWKIVGGIGNDYITDGGGSDTIDTGGGADIVRYFGGNDIVTLGDGDDTYVVTQPADKSQHVSVDGGTGHNELQFSSVASAEGISFDLAMHTAQAGLATFTITGFESVTASSPLVTNYQGPPPVAGWHGTFAGDDQANSISISGSGDGVFLGRGGNDFISADLSGGATLFGGAGNDFVIGDDGNDWIMGDGDYAADPVPSSTTEGGSDVLDGNAGNDHIWGNSQTVAQGSIDGGDRILGGRGADYVNGNGGNDTITGDGGPDRLYGGAGDDLIWGESNGDTSSAEGGNDHINGNKGNDTLHGAGGDDELLGGQGDDVLDPGHGIDTLTGNLGRDLFLLNGCDFATSGPRADQTDLITDFTHGEDRMATADPVVAVLHPGQAADFAAALAIAQAVIPAKDPAHDPQGQEAAAIQVGSDTYLFFANYGHGVEQAVRLANINASIIGVSDFTS